MSGLFAAAFLRRIGWDTDVYERSSAELVGPGAGWLADPSSPAGRGVVVRGRETTPVQTYRWVP